MGNTCSQGSKVSRKAGSAVLARCLWVFWAILLGVPMCFGQGTTATLGGKVLDAQGRAIPHATVVLTSDDTGVHWDKSTNGAGDWRVESLVSGHYRFRVAAKGFKTAEHPTLQLQIADQKSIDVTMEPGTTTETVVVQSTSPLLDTTSAVSGTVITTRQLEELLSQTNNPLSYVGLAPGVSLGPPSGGAAHLWSNASFSAVMVNATGSGTNAVNYQIDGGTNTVGQAGVAYIPPLDSVSELRVSTNAYDASIGRTAGGTIDLSLKSGARQYHGVAYEMNQNNTLNARYYQNVGVRQPVPPVHLNEYGGTVGGPVWIPNLFDGRKKQTFFFLSFDGIRNVSPQATGFTSLPTALETSGDFSQSFTTVTTNGVTTRYPLSLYDPLTTDD